MIRHYIGMDNWREGVPRDDLAEEAINDLNPDFRETQPLTANFTWAMEAGVLNIE